MILHLTSKRGLDYTVNLLVIIALQFAVTVPQRSNQYFYSFFNVLDIQHIKPSESDPPFGSQDCTSET